MTPMKMLKDGKQISKTLRIPIYSQKLPNTTLDKLCQQAIEKDMERCIKFKLHRSGAQHHYKSTALQVGVVKGKGSKNILVELIVFGMNHLSHWWHRGKVSSKHDLLEHLSFYSPGAIHRYFS
jgi:hypothetical protein